MIPFSNLDPKRDPEPPEPYLSLVPLPRGELEPDPDYSEAGQEVEDLQGIQVPAPLKQHVIGAKADDGSVTARQAGGGSTQLEAWLALAAERGQNFTSNYVFPGS
jgi:hypothetical protein